MKKSDQYTKYFQDRTLYKQSQKKKPISQRTAQEIKNYIEICEKNPEIIEADPIFYEQVKALLKNS